MQRIIYMEGDAVAMIIPADCGLTIEEIAAKDVPSGVPYAIVAAADVPDDYHARLAWAAALSFCDGAGA